MNSRPVQTLKRQAAPIALILLALALTTPPAPSSAQSGTEAALPEIDMLGAESSSPTLSVEFGQGVSRLSAASFPDLEATLRKRERELTEREKAVDQKVSYLESLKADLDRKILEYKDAKKALEEAYGIADKRVEKRLKALAPIYEGMTPEKAAIAIAGAATTKAGTEPQGLTNQEALQLMELMDSKKASKVLEAMVASNQLRAMELTKEMFKTVAPQ